MDTREGQAPAGHGPRRKAVEAVARRFREAANREARGTVHMSFTKVRHMDHDHEEGCRTVGCHGGWYALIRIEEDEGRRLLLSEAHDSDQPEMPCGREMRDPATDRAVCWDHGARMLAEDLGFGSDGIHALTWHAQSHPEWWGNTHGGRMFCNAAAFGEKETERLGSGTTTTLETIARHWEGVAERTVDADEATTARATAGHDSAFWTEGVIRVSEPTRIGRHEWRLVLYHGTFMHYAEPQGRWTESPCQHVGYEWRSTSVPERWRRDTEWPRYDTNDGQFMGLPRRLLTLWERCPWAHDLRSKRAAQDAKSQDSVRTEGAPPESIPAPEGDGGD